jgi:large subunit ribosomal protein L17
MRHRLAGRHLGRDTAHRVALYRNLVTDLLRYERITTTEAKRNPPYGRADYHPRPSWRPPRPSPGQRFVYDPVVVRKTFDEIAPA